MQEQNVSLLARGYFIALTIILLLLMVPHTFAQTQNEMLRSGIKGKHPKYSKFEYKVTQNGNICIFEKGDLHIFIDNTKVNESYLCLEEGGQIKSSELIGYRVQRPYLRKVVYFDIDNNKTDDIIIFSYPLGASGLSGNINNVLCVLRHEKGILKLVSYRSFFADESNFIDINNDGIFEFVCFYYYSTEEQNGKLEFYIRNIFDLNHHNLTSEYKMQKVFQINDSNLIENTTISLPDSIIFKKTPYVNQRLNN